jgi:hypothetical protein
MSFSTLARNADRDNWCKMTTIYDFVTIAIFGGLVVLFLQRSVEPNRKQDTILHYLPPAVGCAVANYLGNHGQGTIAIFIVVAIVGYVIFVMKPFHRES